MNSEVKELFTLILKSTRMIPEEGQSESEDKILNK